MKSLRFTGPLQYEKVYHPWEQKVKKKLESSARDLQLLLFQVEFGSLPQKELHEKILGLSERLGDAAKEIRVQEEKEVVSRRD